MSCNFNMDNFLKIGFECAFYFAFSTCRCLRCTDCANARNSIDDEVIFKNSISQIHEIEQIDTVM